jgi:succinate-semialdehyde dehydrogenase / glutarate-semialdehyde dehydrogenase
MSVDAPATSGTATQSSTIGDVGLLVGGAWRDGAAGRLDVVDPATGAAAGTVSKAGPRDIDDALAAAAGAFPAWAALPASERGAILRDAAQLLRERGDDVARGLSVEAGKLPAEAAAEVGRAIETLQWNGEEAGRIEGRVIAGRAPAGVRLSVPAPVGVVAAFAAWNFPAVLAARKLGAALAAGCTVVFKAAEEAPRTAAEIVRALLDAGAPPGVVNLVFGDPPQVSEQLIRAPEVRAVTFTGSTAVGRRIAALAAEGPKRAVLELGGHAPVVVDADADLDLVVTATLPAKFGSAGQSCVAPSRYLVHADLYDELVERFTAAAAALRAGAPTDPEARLGPVIGERRLDALRRLTDDATARGASVRCGGTPLAGPGYFWPATVLADVPDDAAVMREEPFGPIAAFTRFDGLDEAVERANATGYAFAAYVFTDSLTARRRLLAGLEATNIGVNQMAPSMPDAPLGGMQDSGYGYEGGRDGIHAFQHFRLISETAPGS